MPVKFLVGCLFFPMSLAYAQQAAFCPDLFKLSGSVRSCSFNALFVKAADACNAAIDKQVNARSTSLSKAMGQSNQASASAQLAELGTHSGNLADSSNSLNTLRGNAVHAKAQMVEYRDNFMHPGGIGKVLASKLHKPFLDWLEQWPCYSENNALITKYIGIMDTKIAQLDHTLGGVSQLSDSTGAAIRQISSGNGSEAKTVKNTQAQGSGKFRKNPQNNSSSTITGVKEDAAKRAKDPSSQ